MKTCGLVLCAVSLLAGCRDSVKDPVKDGPQLVDAGKSGASTPDATPGNPSKDAAQGPVVSSDTGAPKGGSPDADPRDASIPDARSRDAHFADVSTHITGPGRCRPISESTTLAGNHARYEYTYGAAGQLTKIEKFIGDAYNVLQDSTTVGDNTIVLDHGLDYPAGATQWTTHFEHGGVADGLPTRSENAFTEKGVTMTNVMSWYFFYDENDRLTKVGEQTDLVMGDNEYDLSIGYDDDDNAISLRYEFTTGPATVSTITASGYDDKPNPYSEVLHWYNLMHAGWDNSDPEPVFTALSKHNLLGYTLPGGFTRRTAYTYNEQGYPLTRTQTNTNGSSSSTFEETFEYDCR
jgi:YD repeat-containing protein